MKMKSEENHTKKDALKKIIAVYENAVSFSDDKNTQTGAVMTDPNGVVILAASNTLTNGVTPTEERTTRPGKVPWIEHAERSLIYAAAAEGIKTKGMHMHMRWFPCADCARAIAQAGISVLYCDPQPEQNEQYRFTEASEILKYADVTIRQQEITSDAIERSENP